MPHDMKKNEIQSILAKYRDRIAQGKSVKTNEIAGELESRLIIISNSFRRVINGTGVVIHTNLGRSPYNQQMIQSLHTLEDSYVSLEMNLDSGKRGSRHDHLRPWIQAIAGAEDGILVNNNAAAVLLALNSLANRKEVIISRGQLVEIGGSFRIPEILKKAGSKLVEVGTTNRTHLSDYEAAITDRTRLLLWVHSSNYKISGFTKEVSITDLVALGKRHNIPVMADLGSGSLVPIDQFGLAREPLVSEILSAEADVVTFSVDKLLAGPQGGIIAGKHDLMKKIEKNHLLRALRPDKSQILMVLQALKSFSHTGSIRENSPVYRDFSSSPGELKQRIDQIISTVDNEAVKLTIVETTAEVGSGASPSETMPSMALEVLHTKKSPTAISSQLRVQDPAILGRIRDNRFLLDFKAIRPTEDGLVVKALSEL